MVSKSTYVIILLKRFSQDFDVNLKIVLRIVNVSLVIDVYLWKEIDCV